MRLVAKLAFAAACSLASVSAFADQGAYPQTKEERADALRALTWQHAAQSYPLEDAHASVVLRPGMALVLGADARRLRWLIDGVEFPDTVASATYSTGSAQAFASVEWHEDGYVRDGDWDKVDIDKLLADYRNATERSNDDRVDNGRKALRVVGWLQEPYYNESTHTVTYAMEVTNGEGSIANAVALRLGRDGYASVMWSGSLGVFQSAGYPPALLNVVLSSYKFDQGHRYEDYQSGDRVADYGLSEIVGESMGVKFGFFGLVALVLAGKKIVIPVVIALGGAFARFRRRLFGADS